MNLSALAAVLILCAAPARAYDSIKFLEPIKGEETVRPVAAAATRDRLYIVDDKKSMLFIYDVSGKLIKSVGRSGDQPGTFSGPRGVAVGPGGKVYVADTGNSRVQIFDRDGNFVYAFGEKGSEPGKLRAPESVAVGGDGRIYVADTGNDRVQVFTLEGILLFQFGGSGKEPGMFRSPARVLVDPADGVYVYDRGNDRIQVFDAHARFSRELAMTGNDLAVDAYGFMYVLDGRNGKVVEQAANGFIQGRFGSYGTGVGQMKKAEGIAVGPDGGLIVLDTGNNRIHRVELTNKLKVTPLAQNLETKMSVSGPTRSLPLEASVLAALEDRLYAYLPREGRFAMIDESGKEKKRFGTAKSKGPDATKGTEGFAASEKLGLYVSDTPNSRLQRFDLDGKWQANVGESTGFFDSKKKEGRMSDPHGVAINDDGTVYVADTGNRRIDAFNPEGIFLFGIGPKVGPYELIEPVAAAWDKAGFLYFADRGLKKVFKCEPSGAFIAAWGEEGSAPGQFRSPVSVAFDAQGYVYTLDSELRRISVHTRDGRWLTDFFAGGRQERELFGPTAIAVQGGRLVIADKGKARLVSYDLHPLLAAPSSVSTTTKDGVVSLSWSAATDPWAAGYLVTRSTGAYGPWEKAGEPKEPEFQDSEVASSAKYYYRVATVAKTKDVGPAGRPIEVTVTGAVNRAPVEISTITLGNVFPANYKWYLKNPIGSVSVTNNVNAPFLNVKVTFKLKDFMDFGFDTEIKTLGPKETVQVPLIATLNNRILEVTEDTPIQAELSLTYFESGKQQTVSLTKPLRMYSRNAITWEDPRKIANFVTRKDPPILDFAKAVETQAYKNRKAGALNDSVVKALKLWNALGEYGIKFAANPANPFETVSEDPNFPVDYTQYPRETMKRKTGQCSDLTSLYASMLDADEVDVAVIDYPGHMTLMFNTEAEDAEEAGLPADLLVEREGTMWVPIEVTYVGKPFYEAVSKAAYAYKAEAAKGRAKLHAIHEDWAVYEPVTMPPTDFSPAAPDAAALEKRFDDQADLLAKERYQLLKKHYADALKADGKDSDAQLQLGIVEYQFGNEAAAVAEFGKVLALDPKNAAALNNLGNIAFLKGDAAEAERRYAQASEADPEDPVVWLNRMKAALKLKKGDTAREFGGKAVDLAPSFKPFVDALTKGA